MSDSIRNNQIRFCKQKYNDNEFSEVLQISLGEHFEYTEIVLYSFFHFHTNDNCR